MQVYQAMDPSLVAKYISGSTVFFKEIGAQDYTMKQVQPYLNSYDVYRLSHTGYVFLVDEHKLTGKYTMAVIQLAEGILDKTLTDHDYMLSKRDQLYPIVVDAVCAAYYQGGEDAAEIN